MTTCRFDATKIDKPVGTTDGTESFHYLCADCGRWHWALPDMEAQGTEHSPSACVEAITEVLDQWYAATAGTTFSQAVKDGTTKAWHVSWRPPSDA